VRLTCRRSEVTSNAKTTEFVGYASRASQNNNAGRENVCHYFVDRLSGTCKVGAFCPIVNVSLPPWLVRVGLLSLASHQSHFIWCVIVHTWTRHPGSRAEGLGGIGARDHQECHGRLASWRISGSYRALDPLLFVHNSSSSSFYFLAATFDHALVYSGMTKILFPCPRGGRTFPAKEAIIQQAMTTLRFGPIRVRDQRLYFDVDDNNVRRCAASTGRGGASTWSAFDSQYAQTQPRKQARKRSTRNGSATCGPTHDGILPFGPIIGIIVRPQDHAAAASFSSPGTATSQSRRSRINKNKHTAKATTTFEPAKAAPYVRPMNQLQSIPTS
jgi:hypothetical protein